MKKEVFFYTDPSLILWKVPVGRKGYERDATVKSICYLTDMIVVKIFYAILLVLSWYYLIKFRRVVKSWTGTFFWAEKYLWNGGTYVVLIFVGLFLMFWGVLYPFGGLNLIFGTPPKDSEEIHDMQKQNYIEQPN